SRWRLLLFRIFYVSICTWVWRKGRWNMSDFYRQDGRTKDAMMDDIHTSNIDEDNAVASWGSRHNQIRDEGKIILPQMSWKRIGDDLYHEHHKDDGDFLIKFLGLKKLI